MYNNNTMASRRKMYCKIIISFKKISRSVVEPDKNIFVLGKLNTNRVHHTI